MRTLELPSFAELINGCSESALHLEMRDTYVPSDPSFVAFTGGPPFDRTDRESRWHELIGGVVSRGVRVRRARVISEPVTDYIRFEYAVTESMNLTAGEEVRWLPRHQAADLLLPGNDFWVFDDRLVRFHHFAGDGEHVRDELTDERDIVTQCRASFEAVWGRAIDHSDYHPA